MSGAIGHTLTQGEILAFLARHPIIAARVLEFTAVVNTVGYDQAPTPPGGWNILDYDMVDYWLSQLPGWIPTWGLGVVDSVWRNVVIFPDAVGNLRYTGVDTLPADINLPAPHPVPDDSPLSQVMNWAVMAGLAWAALEVYKATRR